MKLDSGGTTDIIIADRLILPSIPTRLERKYAVEQASSVASSRAQQCQSTLYRYRSFPSTEVYACSFTDIHDSNVECLVFELDNTLLLVSYTGCGDCRWTSEESRIDIHQSA